MQNRNLLRIYIFLLIALASVLTGGLLIGEGIIYYVFIYAGYPNIFITFLLFLASLVYALRKEPRSFRFLPRDGAGWGLVLLTIAAWLTIEPFEFKIVFDEPILSTVAQMMHFDRLSGMPREGNDFGGSYLLLNSFMDKRPLFFPFLLSTVHDLLGFRFENVFLLNALLSGLLVFLIHSLGNLLGGKTGGRLSLVLALTLPLFTIFSTSGHFEILNLVMICLVLLLSHNYLTNPKESTVVPLVFALLLFFHVRYENGIYILPFGLLILLGWKRAGKPLLPWPVMMAPMLLIVYLIQYRYILDGSKGFFQEGPKGRADTFSLTYSAENLQSALDFFFAAGQQQPNSYILSVFGLSAIMVLFFRDLKSDREAGGSGSPRMVIWGLLGAVILYALVLAFFNFGLLDRYITNRLSLPIYLGWIFFSVYVYARFPRELLLTSLVGGCLAALFTIVNYPVESFRPFLVQFAPLLLIYIAVIWLAVRQLHRRNPLVFSLLALILFTTTMPITRAHRYSQAYRANDTLMEQIRFIEERKPSEKLMWISSTPYPAILTETNYKTIESFNNSPEVIAKHLADTTHNAFYLARIHSINEDGEWELHYGVLDEFDEKVFDFETVWEYAVEPGAILRISRLTAVNLPDPVERAPEDGQEETKE